ncbi:MAG: homocysteine S-methyltransferase family protein, partial [Actinomycetes bacterium]|nr:homocysteine S-methyltransferase family protein [Actinomycetes bacterium]
MSDFLTRLGRDMLVLEGAMGTMLQAADIEYDGAPEALNLTAPDVITGIHRLYHEAGADCAITNTFGGSRPQLSAHAHGATDILVDVNRVAVELARAGGAPYVLADLGPTGLVMEPLGSATFDEVYEAFAEQAAALAQGRPDAFLLETFTDIAEVRAAALACRDVDADIPVLALVTFGSDGRMELSGTDPATAAIILRAVGAAAVGMNCGLGPAQMGPLAQAMLAATTLPVITQPNAGLPELRADGHTHFPGTPEDFRTFAHAMRQAGVAAIGSCCGSTPDFTAVIADEVGGKAVIAVPSQARGVSVGTPSDPEGRLASVGSAVVGGRQSDASAGKLSLQTSSPARPTIVASPRAHVAIGAGNPCRIIGERINPTGKARLKDSLLTGSMSVVRQFAIEQAADHADLLDINVGAAGIDEAATLPRAVITVAALSSLPLSIDTTNVAALETSLKRYPGKALVNSVTGEERSLSTILPLVARYGAAVVVLPLDDDGIPPTVEARLAVVEKIRERAHTYHIPDEDLLVDSLVMAAAADPDAPTVTLDTMETVKTRLHLNTLLGVSNVSHGLPNRPALNRAFLAAAMARGLDAAIFNPGEIAGELVGNDRSSHGEITTLTTLSWQVFTDTLTQALEIPKSNAAHREASGNAPADTPDPAAQLTAAVQQGDSDGAPALVDALTSEGMTATDIIEGVLTPAIQELGAGFATGAVFLPQLMAAAEAMKAAVAQAKTHLPDGQADAAPRGRVVFATVKGDIHSIGKDICVSLLESQNIAVNDLGVDVDPQAILAAARGADVVCLSALMTTTLPAMEATTVALRQNDPNLPVALGGAVVTRDWAASVGALYTKDAPA